MDRVNWFMALQYRLHICKSNNGAAIQISGKSKNVQTVSEYSIDFVCTGRNMAYYFYVVVLIILGH